MPRSPIHEEQNVAGFFLNDRLEGVDQGGGKESGTLRGLEQSKSKETVDAFTVAGDHECPLRVSLHDILRLWCQRDAIRGDEIGEHQFVAALLKGVELNGFAQQGIGRDGSVR